jgi:PAS domain S-box-containing protein
MAERAAEAERVQLAKSIAQLDRHVLESMCTRNLLANPEERVFFKDLDSRFVLVSAGFLLDQAPGRSFAEMTGKTDFDLFSDEHASAAFADEQRIIRTSDRMVAKVERETFYDRPDAWVSTTKLPLRDEDGHIVGTFGISRDVTAQVLAEQALVESEERFRLAFEQAPIGICWLDPAGVIVEVNPALTEITGLTAAQLVGKTPAVFWHPDDAADTTADLGQLLRGELNSYTRERRFVRSDGSIRNVNVAVSVVRGPDDEGRHRAIATVEDITERRQLADELHQAQELEALGRLAGGIAHEINTPIQFIGDNLRFLADVLPELVGQTSGLDQAETDGTPSDGFDMSVEVRAAIEQSLEGVARVAAIVRAMKAFGHRVGTRPAPADLNEALKTTLVIASNEFKYVADIDVELGDIPPVPCYVGELSQAFLNLVVNAAHAIAERVAGTSGRGRITARTWADDASVYISVADTGTGMPDAVAEHIYEPFFTTKALGKGTGQGLSIARATVVIRHGGTIDFTTKAGEGTTFIVRIPTTWKGE